MVYTVAVMPQALWVVTYILYSSSIMPLQTHTLMLWVWMSIGGLRYGDPLHTHGNTDTHIHTHKDIHQRTCTNTSTHILTWAAVITAIEQPSVPLVLHKSWSWMARLWHDYPIRHGDELVKETVKLFKGFYGIWQNKEMVTMQTDTQTAKIETGLTLKRSSVQSLAIRLNATWNNLPHVFVAVLQFQHKYQVVSCVSG